MLQWLKPTKGESRKGEVEVMATTNYNVVKSYVKDVLMGVLCGELSAKDVGACMIWGPPGIGKSALVKTVAEECGVPMVDIRLAQMESIDIRGLPVPDKDDKSVSWFPSKIFPKTEEGGIIFLDELSACPKDVQAASYELILDRQLGGGEVYKVPEKWIIVAAGNRTSDSAISIRMSSALANRVTHFELDVNFDDWMNWAISKGIHPSVVSYLKTNPKNLHLTEDQNLERGFPTPRSWERVSAITYFIKDMNVLDAAVKGLVGEAAGREFMNHHKSNRVFGDVLEMMTNPNAPIVIPKTIGDKWAMTSAMVYHLWHGKSESDTSNRLNGFFRIASELNASFSTMVQTAACDTIQHRKIVMTSPKYREWRNKFKDSINQSYEV